MNDPKIRPCPFCGNVGVLARNELDLIATHIRGSYFVRCTICHADGPFVTGREKNRVKEYLQQAIKKWNERVKDENNTIQS